MSYLGLGTGGFSGILSALGDSASERVGEALYWFIKQARTDPEMPDDMVELAEKLEVDLQGADWKYNKMQGQRAQLHDVSPTFSRPSDVYSTSSDISMDVDDSLENATQAEKDRQARKQMRNRRRSDSESDEERDEMLKNISQWEKKQSAPPALPMTPTMSGGRKHYCKKHKKCRYCGERHH